MKKTVVFFFIIVLLVFNTLGAAAAETTNTSTQETTKTIDVDFSESNTGIVNVLFNTGTEKKVKLLVQLDKTKYYYNIKSNEEYVSIPLQFGDGEYKIRIYENTSGNSYKKVFSANETVEIEDELAVFLTSNQEIAWDEEDVTIQLTNMLVEEALIAKNEALFEDAVLEADYDEMTEEEIEAFELERAAYFENEDIEPLTDEEIIEIVYDYVITNISYDYDKINDLEYDYIPEIDVVLEDGSGICYDYSVMVASMLRSQGIPTKLIKGYAEFTEVYHAWNEIYLSETEEWVVVDTTFDAYMISMDKDVTMAKLEEEYKTSKSF